jgi:hypothetical protein
MSGKVKAGSWEYLIISQLQKIELIQDEIQSLACDYGDLEPPYEYLRERLLQADKRLMLGIEGLDISKLDLPEDYKRQFDRWLSFQESKV